MTKQTFIITILVAAVVGSVGFLGGVNYQKSQRGSREPGQLTNGQARQGGAPNGLRQGIVRPVSGEITAVEGETLTVKSPDGSSKIIIVSEATTITKSSEASSADLQVGEEVMIMGSEDAQGTVTAQNISLGADRFPPSTSGDQPASADN